MIEADVDCVHIGAFSLDDSVVDWYAMYVARMLRIFNEVFPDYGGAVRHVLSVT